MWAKPAANGPTPAEQPDYGRLWDRLGAVRMPVLLVRGMRTQSVVEDADEAEFRRRLPQGDVARVAEAGHSVQGDTPLELAELLESFTFGPAGR